MKGVREIVLKKKGRPVGPSLGNMEKYESRTIKMNYPTKDPTYHI